MEITENMRKTAHGLADSVKDTVNALEQGAKDGARIDTSKGSLIEELSKINNYFNDSKQSKANDDFVKDVILFAQLQVDAAKRFFDNSGNEATKILEQSQYWNSAKPYFYVISINYIGYIADNYQAFVNMLRVTKEAQPDYIDTMLKELIEAAKNDSQPISDIKLTHFLAIYATITDTCKFKGLEPTEENILECNKELLDDITEKTNEVKEKPKQEPQSAKVYNTDFIRWNTDRVSNNFVSIFKEAQQKKGLALITSAKKKDTIALYFTGKDDITFDDLTKKLGISISYKDKLYYMIVSTLYDAGNEYITASQIYKTLHDGKKPKQKDVVEIYESIERMSLIKVNINNELEHSVYKSYRLEPNTSRYFLAAETNVYDKTFRGKKADCAFHLLTRPLFADIAKDRRQFIEIKTKIFSDAEISYTEKNICLFDCLIQQVSLNNTDKGSGVIRYDFLYDALQITDRHQKPRAVATSEKILKSFEKNNLIGKVEKTDKGFSIYPKKPEEPPIKNDHTKTKINTKSKTHRKG